MDIKLTQQLVKLMVDNQIDHIKCGEIEISKSKHLPASPAKPAVPLNMPASLMDPDEMLFYSTSTPTLTLSEIEQFAANGAELPKPKKAKRITK